jgi:hypothetical protein
VVKFFKAERRTGERATDGYVYRSEKRENAGDLQHEKCLERAGRATHGSDKCENEGWIIKSSILARRFSDLSAQKFDGEKEVPHYFTFFRHTCNVQRYLNRNERLFHLPGNVMPVPEFLTTFLPDRPFFESPLR